MDYIRADSKLQFYPRKPRKTMTYVLVPIYISRALNMGTCIQQGDLPYSAGPHRNQCSPQLTHEKLGGGFGKTADEWTGRVEIGKEEIPGSKRNMYS